MRKSTFRNLRSQLRESFQSYHDMGADGRAAIGYGKKTYIGSNGERHAQLIRRIGKKHNLTDPDIDALLWRNEMRFGHHNKATGKTYWEAPLNEGRQLRQIQEQWLTEQSGLVVARKMPDGTVRYGKPGQIHVELMDDLRGEYKDEDFGFAHPGGKFMSRIEASAWVKRHQPKVHKELAGRMGDADGELESRIYDAAMTTVKYAPLRARNNRQIIEQHNKEIHWSDFPQGAAAIKYKNKAIIGEPGQHHSTLIKSLMDKHNLSDDDITNLSINRGIIYGQHDHATKKTYWDKPYWKKPRQQYVRENFHIARKTKPGKLRFFTHDPTGSNVAVLHTQDGTHSYVTGLKTDPAHRRKGGADIVMKKATAYLDKHKLEADLSAVPMDDKSPDRATLRKFYEKHGFTSTSEKMPNFMTRKPRSLKQIKEAFHYTSVPNGAPAVKFNNKTFIGKKHWWHIDLMKDIAKETGMRPGDFAAAIEAKKFHYGHHNLDTGETYWEDKRLQEAFQHYSEMKNGVPAIKFRGTEYIGKPGQWHHDLVDKVRQDHDLDDEELGTALMHGFKYGHHNLDTGETHYQEVYPHRHRSDR